MYCFKIFSLPANAASEPAVEILVEYFCGLPTWCQAGQQIALVNRRDLDGFVMFDIEVAGRLTEYRVGRDPADAYWEAVDADGRLRRSCWLDECGDPAVGAAWRLMADIL